MFFILLWYLHFIFVVVPSFVDVLHFVVVLLIFFSTSSLTLPWTIVGVFTPHFILSAQPIAEWLATLSFVQPFRSCRERYGLEWAFFTRSRFLPYCSFTDILTCVYQGFPGSRQFFLQVCRASYWSSKQRPGPSICLIHSNPQTSNSERFSFKFYYILAWITCGSSLIYLLLTRFELFSLVQSHR